MDGENAAKMICGRGAFDAFSVEMERFEIRISVDEVSVPLHYLCCNSVLVVIKENLYLLCYRCSLLACSNVDF